MLPELNIPILMYHEITAERLIASVSKKTHRTFILPYQAFSTQMQWLVDNGFTTISLPALLQILAGVRRPPQDKKNIVITFDDGFAGNYFYALPILKELHLTATFFVIVNRIGLPFYMSWPQLSALIENGMEVQSHTMTHALLGQAALSHLMYELGESKCQLEEHLHKRVDFVSLPHGSYQGNFKAAAQECGYAGACTSEIAYVERQTDAYSLPRHVISSRYDLTAFANLAHCRPGFLKQQLAASKFKRLLRRIVGEQNYNRAYHFVYNIEAD